MIKSPGLINSNPSSDNLRVYLWLGLACKLSKVWAFLSASAWVTIVSSNSSKALVPISLTLFLSTLLDLTSLPYTVTSLKKSNKDSPLLIEINLIVESSELNLILV